MELVKHRTVKPEHSWLGRVAAWGDKIPQMRNQMPGGPLPTPKSYHFPFLFIQSLTFKTIHHIMVKPTNQLYKWIANDNEPAREVAAIVLLFGIVYDNRNS